MTTRAFLAVPCPEAWRTDLTIAQSSLKFGRLMDPDDFHVTLVFLGDCTDLELDELHSSLDAMRAPPFDIRLGEAGHFGKGAPRTLMFHVRPDPPLLHLQSRLERIARQAGIEVPSRRYTPHVTVARLSGHEADAPAVARWLSERRPLALPPARIDAVTLYASHLRPDGAEHDEMARYPLRG